MAQVDIALTKYTKHVPVTEEFLSAKNSNWESWIADVLGRTEAGTENNLSHTVVAAGATAGTAFAHATTITVAELASVVGELSYGYAVPSEAGFLLRNATKWYCLGLTGDSFAFLNTPQSPGMFGYPVYVCDDVPARDSGVYSVIFGNWRYLGVAETPGMVVRRNPYDRMYKGEVSIYASIRRGYAVLQAEAIRKHAGA
jgi:HK97 family phage major capsid protein